MKISENDCSSDEAGTSSAGTATFGIKVNKISLSLIFFLGGGQNPNFNGTRPFHDVPTYLNLS